MSIKAVEPNRAILGASKKEDSSASNLRDLVDAMKDVKTDTPEAELNSKSITDANGDRIELNRDKLKQRSTIMGNLRNKEF